MLWSPNFQNQLLQIITRSNIQDNDKTLLINNLKNFQVRQKAGCFTAVSWMIFASIYVYTLNRTNYVEYTTRQLVIDIFLGFSALVYLKKISTQYNEMVKSAAALSLRLKIAGLNLNL